MKKCSFIFTLLSKFHFLAKTFFYLNNTFRHIPFVRLLIPLVIGIILGVNFTFPPLWGFCLVLLPLVCTFAYRQGKIAAHRFGVVSLAFICCLGITLVQEKNPLSNTGHFSHHIDTKKTQTFIGIVQGTPKNKGNKIESNIALKSLKKQEKWRPVQGTIKAYIKPNSKTSLLKYGDRVIIQSYINPSRSPTNPKAFDYAKYLKYQGISHTCFVQKNNIKILEESTPSILLSKSYALRKQMLSTLNVHLTSENERAVGEALILGFKDNMTDEVQNAYASTGATHVLAVSGLHVGILYLLVRLLLGFLKGKSRQIQWVKLLLSLLVIWGFALLTGASPSVLRAATMFSFVAVGDVLARNKNIYNTLAASAFVLLCIQPLLLFNVGFQLSYLAVIGIVFFQPLIYKSWYVKGKLGQFVWGLLSVSLAAQITTLPISLFYFHQFPTYFLLSGLVVVPAASLIMSLGLAVMGLEYLMAGGIFAEILGQLLYAIIWLVNSVIFLMGKLPFHLIENIYLSGFETFLCYLGIIGIMAWIETGKKWYLYVFFGLLMTVGISMNIRFFQHQHQEEYVIYDSPKLLIDGFINGQCLSFQHPVLEEKQIQFAAKEFRNFKGMPVSKDVFIHNDFLAVGHKRFYILQEDFRYISHTEKIRVDGIIIQNQPFIDFKLLEKAFDFDYIIADGSNKASRVKKWRGFYKGEKPFYYTKETAIVLEDKK